VNNIDHTPNFYNAIFAVSLTKLYESLR
jgi:hypothetical protein